MEQHALKAALEWYLDNGVDEALGDVPADYFAAPVSVAAMGAAAPLAGDVGAARKTQAAQALQGSSLSPALGAADARAEAIKIAQTADSLESLRAAIAAFDGIALKKTASNLVFGEGNPQASIMIIGDVPGTEEDKTGRPFMGAAGFLFDKMLASIGLNRLPEASPQSVYVSNILNWRPPGNRTPAPGEIEASLPFIERQIQLVNPDILVFMGALPAQSLLARSEGISKLRKGWHSFNPLALPQADGVKDSVPALVTFHPSYLLGMPQQKRLAWADLLMLKAKMQG